MSDKSKILPSDPKQRNIILFGISLGVVIALTGIYMINKSNAQNRVASNSSVASTPNVIIAPGASESALYNEKVDKSNKIEAEKALKQDQTFVATPTNQNAFKNESPIDELDKQIKAQQEKERELKEKTTEVVNEQERIESTSVEPPPPVVMAPKSQPQVVVYTPPQPKKKYGSDEDYMLLSTLIEAWKIKESSAEFDFARQRGGSFNATNQNNNTNANSTFSETTKNDERAQIQTLAKAGTIFNAILETGINSDEPSPVLAKIISGEFKGARLIGKMTTVGEKVIVEFKTMNIPTLPNSIAINAVAVDPTTSRTALATDVDHHYFMKYGLILAASFLSGYADALRTKNQICTTNSFGSTTCQNNGGFSAAELNKQAIGNVGRELINQTRSQIQNIKPTIRVEAGSAIGILLMDDLKLN